MRTPRLPWSEYIGMRFGRLSVVGFGTKGKNKIANCDCDCGSTAAPIWSNIKQGRTISCGCRERETWAEKSKGYNCRDNATYNSWDSMKNRCNPSNKQHAPGYAGVEICPRWLGEHGFKNFLEDMGERPQGMTLDRVNNFSGYSPGNCRWASKKTQQQNRNTCKSVIEDGQVMTVSEYATLKGLSYMRAWHKLTKADRLGNYTPGLI